MQTNIQLLFFFALSKHTVKIYNHLLVYIHINLFVLFKHTVKNVYSQVIKNNHLLVYIHINTHNNYHKKYT